MAAIHGDDIMAEGEPEKLDRLDGVLKQLVVVKVLDRVGPRAAEHGQCLKRLVVYINGQGFEWLEDPKHLAAIIRNRSKVDAKPQCSPGSKDLGKSDPEALDELEEVEGKLYRQDSGINMYVSSGRFDIQFCVQRLSEMVTKPRRLGNLRLARLASYLVGTEKLVLRFDHQEYGDTVRIAVDSDWAGSEERCSNARRDGIPWRTSRGFVGCIRSSASIPEKQSSTESWMARHEESSQSTCTRRWDEPSTSTSKRTRRLRSGCVPERALEGPDTFKFVGCGFKMLFVIRLCV